MPDIPGLLLMKIDQISSFGAFYTAAAAFLIAVITLFVTSIMMFLAFRQYSDVKKSEFNLKNMENKQVRFDNAFKLLSILGTHQGGSFAELAAIESLVSYKEFHEVYKYMLQRFKTFPPNDEINIFVKRIENLVEKTK